MNILPMTKNDSQVYNELTAINGWF